jgi:hypothetical protein
VHKNKGKKDDNKRQLVVVFFGCIETKEKKMMMNIGSLLSSVGA